MQVVSFGSVGVGVGGGVGPAVMARVVWFWTGVGFMSYFMLLFHVICAGALHQDGNY